MVTAQIALRAEQRQNRIVLTLLVCFSWVVTVAGWTVFRFMTGGFLSLFEHPVSPDLAVIRDVFSFDMAGGGECRCAAFDAAPAGTRVAL